MKPFSRSLLDLFDSKRRYVIPLFQRQYSWKQEEQLEPLWSDVVDKAERRLGNHEQPQHFLGAIVIDLQKTFGNELPEYLVIDGQQRLTTFQLLLAAFRDYCRSQNNLRYAEELDRYVLNTGIMANEQVEKYKVWPTQTDRRQFQLAVAGDGVGAVQKAAAGEFSVKKLGVEPRILDSYLYFYESIRRFCEDERAEPSPDRFVEALFTALRKDLVLVSIELEGDDDPQVIFETLNARGEPLAASDLLRNYVLLRATKSGADVEALYQQFWAPLDGVFWKASEGRGRYKRPRVDMFFQYTLQSKTGEEVNVGRLFAEYKRWIATRPFETVEEELREVGRYEQAFRTLVVVDEEAPYWRFIDRLHALEVKTIFPLLLYLLCDSKLPDEELSGCFTDLESFVVRRFVCRKETRAYSTLFLSLVRELRQVGPSRAALQAALLRGKTDANSWPIDAEFMQAWLTGNAYELKSARLERILMAVEQSLRTKFSEKLEFKSKLTVEHVMPVSWYEHWPKVDGSKALEHFERYMKDISDPEADRRERSVNTFGNLTLLTHNLNASVSNGPFHLKQQKIAEQSALALNRYFVNCDSWDCAEIEARGRELFGHARGIWSRPN